MDNSFEQSIRSLLSTADLLNPISLRIVIDANVGKSEHESPALYYLGRNGEAFEDVDAKFFAIMKSQDQLNIPSLSDSLILTSLGIGDASVFFRKIHTDYGYCGFIWACFNRDSVTDELVERFSALREWAQLIVYQWLQRTLGEQLESRRYLDLLEQVGIPALIFTDSRRTMYSNPTFEGLEEKENILRRLRAEDTENGISPELLETLGGKASRIDFSCDRSGNLLLFPPGTSESSDSRTNGNDLKYYRMLVQKSRGNLAMLDSSDELSNLQRNYVTKAEEPMKRLETLFSFGENHYTRSEKAQSPLVVVSVTELVKNVVMDLAAAARNKRIELEWNVRRSDNGKSSGSALGDPWLLSLAVYCLVDNAIRFTSIDGKPIRIDLTFEEKNWTFRIEDAGLGIAPLDLEKIVSEEAPKMLSSDLQGIPLVKYAAAFHHGSFNAESRLGSGSIFSITIPYR